jgi:CRISPR-associated exonuclease Cas4
MMEPEEYLPLSFLNQLAYCERRFWLMYVQGEMGVNAPVLEGIQQHERTHTAGAGQEEDAVIYHRLYLWSDRLKIAGFADVVEARQGELIPVEYKHGRLGRWGNDQIQLCAQAMCLEERTGQVVACGEIFYWGSRRREAVDFTPELRAQTEAVVQRAYQLLAEGRLPPPLNQRAKCRDCSLEGICLPREVLALNMVSTTPI